MVPGHAHLADEIQFYVSGATFQWLWIWTLAMERTNRFNRRKVRVYRRIGLTVQALYLAFLLIGTWPAKHIAYAAEAAFFIAITTTFWHARSSTDKLHPDDQKIVDQVIEEEERLLAERLQEETARLRKARLDAALAHVRRYTTAETADSSDPEPSPAVKWDIRKGQHNPLVYFIRNGNRIKIGTTTDLYQRVRRLSLRTDNVTLLLAGGRDLERDMHRRFSSLRIGNTEWFRDAPPLSDYITAQLERLQTTNEGE